jgi:hypothetical protein
MDLMRISDSLSLDEDLSFLGNNGETSLFFASKSSLFLLLLNQARILSASSGLVGSPWK